VKEHYQRFVTWISGVDALIFLLSAVTLNRITDWLPQSHINPFPFYNIVYNGQKIGLSWQSYFYFIDLHLIMILFWNYCFKRMAKMAQLFYFYRAVEIVALFDFLLIYEKPFMYIGHYGLEFTDFRVLIYFALYILWKARN